MNSGQITIRLVLAHPHPFFMRGMKELLEHHEHLSVLACYIEISDQNVREEVERLAPDILITDIAMQPLWRPATRSALVERNRPTRTIVIAAEADYSLAREAVAAGVAGVVLANAPPAHLLECIGNVARGERCMPARLVGNAAGPAIASASLSPRERDVARLVARGLPNREVASRLGLTEGTVKVHLHNTFAKLGVTSRSALIVLASSSSGGNL